jgi:hypothetical protein
MGSKGSGIGANVYIDGIGTLEVCIYPEEGVKYKDLIKNKKYIAKKTIERLNAVLLYMEELDEKISD